MTLETITAVQRAIYDSDQSGLVVTAPAGCGKTEVLALRIAGLIERGRVSEPRRILVVTFTNKARDNIRSRLGQYVSPEKMRRCVYIANFHGLASRLICSHGSVIGIDGWTLPSYDWMGGYRREADIGWEAFKRADARIKDLKQRGLSDEDIMRELREAGEQTALQIEQERIAHKQLTYDDLPRYADMLLADERVRELYANHFAFVVVDEYQDLTPQQLRIVQAIGFQKTTYAGDLAQGIYCFAGARPDDVQTEILAECSERYALDESWRSSPAVLRMVNAFVPIVGGTELHAALPDRWPKGGLSAALSFANSFDEARWIADMVAVVAARFPRQRIGVFTRIRKRRRAVEEALSEAGLQFVRWEDGVFEKEIAVELRKLCAPSIVNGLRRADFPMEYLDSVVEPVGFQDPELLAGWRIALDWFCDAVSQGESASVIRDRVTAGEKSFADSEGVHCLNAHTGKGQQFDWVFIAGCEKGVTPYYLAQSQDELQEEARVFSVMLSRAKAGVIATCASRVYDYGKRREFSDQAQSPYLSLMRESGACTDPGRVLAWFDELGAV